MKVEIPKCSSPERYEQYALNVEAKEPEKAQEARRQAVRMRAELKGAKTAAEMECLQAVFAYEWTLFKKHGKRQRASRTWQTIEEHGIVEAVERVVKRTKESAGYRSLLAEGMQDMAFEAVVLRHPELFSEEATAMSRSRLEEWGGA